MSQHTRTPYITLPPSSPLLLFFGGLLSALVVGIISRLGFELPVDTATAMGSSLVGSLVGAVQLWLARQEQSRGRELLEAALAAPPPSSTEDLRAAIEQLRAAALSNSDAEALGTTLAAASTPTAERFAQILGAPMEGEPRRFSRDRAERADRGVQRLDPPVPYDPDEPVPLLEPRAPAPRLPEGNPWVIEAYRAIRAGQRSGKVGPIEWHVGSSVMRLTVLGYSHPVVPGDWARVAEILIGDDGKSAEPEPAPAPVPRRHPPSGALLGDDGEPVSAGDLDSHDEVSP